MLGLCLLYVWKMLAKTGMFCTFNLFFGRPWHQHVRCVCSGLVGMAVDRVHQCMWHLNGYYNWMLCLAVVS